MKFKAVLSIWNQMKAGREGGITASHILNGKAVRVAVREQGSGQGRRHPIDGRIRANLTEHTLPGSVELGAHAAH